MEALAASWASQVVLVVRNWPASGRLRFNPCVGKIPCRRAGQPTPVFLLENSMDRGAWQAAVLSVAQNWTQLS